MGTELTSAPRNKSKGSTHTLWFEPGAWEHTHNTSTWEAESQEIKAILIYEWFKANPGHLTLPLKL